MDEYVILVISGIVMILIVAIVIMRICYHRIIDEKNRGTLRLIREQDSLKKELEYARVEKDEAERLLLSKLDASATAEDKEISKDSNINTIIIRIDKPKILFTCMLIATTLSGFAQQRHLFKFEAKSDLFFLEGNETEPERRYDFVEQNKPHLSLSGVNAGKSKKSMDEDILNSYMIKSTTCEKKKYRCEEKKSTPVDFFPSHVFEKSSDVIKLTTREKKIFARVKKKSSHVNNLSTHEFEKSSDATRALFT
jgi:hypothetical protein